MSRTTKLRVTSQASDQMNMGDEMRWTAVYANNTASTMFNRLGNKSGSASQHHNRSKTSNHKHSVS